MNALVPQPNTSVPQRLLEPILTPRVAAWLRSAEAYADAKERYASAPEERRVGIYVGSPPDTPALNDADRAGIDRALRGLEEQIQPVSPALLRAWLAPVNAAVRNPQPVEEFALRCLGLHEMLSDLPGGAFTAEARRTLPGFFPSAEDIRRAVEPGARLLAARRKALADALAPPAPPPPPPEPRGLRTVDDVLRVKEASRAFAAEVAARTVEERPRPVPRHLTPEQLAEARKAAGIVLPGQQKREGDGA